MDDRKIRVQFVMGTDNFVLRSVHTGGGTDLVYYPVCTKIFFFCGKAVRA
jgi:hypothetical protein